MKPELCSKCGRTIGENETPFLFGQDVVCRDCCDDLNPTCPYCGKPLRRCPKRASSCPHCKQKIYVRRGQRLFYSCLVTHDQTEQLDAIAEREILVKLGPLGVSSEDFAEERTSLRRQFGKEPSIRDVIWRVFHVTLHRQAQAAQRTGSLAHLAPIYRLMAEFRESEGGDGSELRSEAARLERGD